MMLLLTLLELIRCADAKVIMAIVDKLVLPEDQADYERAGEVLWAREREEYRKEIVMQMGWGVIYFYMMERALKENGDSEEYFNASWEQEFDLYEQKMAMAEIIEEYVFILKKEGRLPEWVLMYGKEGGVPVTLQSPDLLERCFEV